jgi:hypothetical protein
MVLHLSIENFSALSRETETTKKPGLPAGCITHRLSLIIQQGIAEVSYFCI